MAKAYSYDLRIRVIKSLAVGNTIKETSKLYSISRKTIIEWKKLKEQTGDVQPRSGYHTGHRRIIRDIEGFKQFIELNRDKTTIELANNWVQKVSASTISRLLNKNEIRKAVTDFEQFFDAVYYGLKKVTTLLR